MIRMDFFIFLFGTSQKGATNLKKEKNCLGMLATNPVLVFVTAKTLKKNIDIFSSFSLGRF